MHLIRNVETHDGVAVREAPFIQPLASGMVEYREDTVQPPIQGTDQRAQVAAARTLVTLQQGSVSVHIKLSLCLHRLDQESSVSNVPGVLPVPHVSPRAARTLEMPSAEWVMRGTASMAGKHSAASPEGHPCI